jgi:hypothetical protein
MLRFTVDKDGFIVDFAPFSSDGKCRLTANASTVDCDSPDGQFEKPKWDGKNWIEGATADELAKIANAQAQSGQPTIEQQAINQLGVMVASLAAKVVSK